MSKTKMNDLFSEMQYGWCLPCLIDLNVLLLGFVLFWRLRLNIGLKICINILAV